MTQIGQLIRMVVALAVKELQMVLRDKRSRFVLIGPPLIQILVFGYAATFDLNQVPIAVFDEDDSVWSHELIASLTGSPAFEARYKIHSDQEVASLIEQRKVLLVIHVASDFSESLLAGRGAPLQLILDGRNSNTAMIALSYVGKIVNDLSARWAERRGLEAPARLDVRARYNPNLESRWFIVPGIIGILTLVVAMVLTALSVARERESGTFDQLLVTPMTPLVILLGKTLPVFLIGTIEATVIMLVAIFWFEVPLEGSILAFYLGLWLFLLSAIGVGLMISSLSATQQQALLGAFMFLVPAIILSGFATPIANMSPAVEILSRANPLRYFMQVLREVFLAGADVGLLWPAFWPMGLIGVVTLTAAAWLFRNRLY